MSAASATPKPIGASRSGHDEARPLIRGAGPPVRLQTHVWNPLGGRRALLVHGLGNDGGTWWRVASSLARKGWLVLAPDLRSHGRSPTADDHRLPSLAEDVTLLGTGWDLVVGHSLGGAIAAHLAALPGMAAATLLLDPALHLDDARRRIIRAMRTTDVGHLDPAELAADNPSWDIRDVYRKVLAAAMVTPDIVDAVLDDNDPWDVTALVAASAGPTHILASDPALDSLCPPEVLARVTGQPGAEVSAQVAPGVSHAFVRDAPDTVLDAIDRLVGLT